MGYKPQAPKYEKAVTFVVASSTSKDRAHVDYVCDGAADESEINEAIGALPI